MGTIKEKLNYLKETKAAIKSAIADKGVDVSDSDTFRSYAEKISEITVGAAEVETEEKTVTLALASGDQTITPSSGKYISKVTITKPDTLLAENIKSGITIAGVTGTYAGESGQPTMNAPTVSISQHTLTITNPSTNGNFLTSFNIYDDSTLKTALTATTTKTYDLYNLGAGSYKIKATANGTYFIESAKTSGTSYSNFTVTRALTGLTSSNTTALIYGGGTWTTTLTASEDGTYIPSVVEVDGADYTYEPYTGVLTISNIKADVTITAEADAAYQLRTPDISLTGTTLTLSGGKYTEAYKIYQDGVLLTTLDAEATNNTATVGAVDSATYGFELTDDGYYTSQNKGVSSSYALCRVTFNMEAAGTVTFSCISYGESNYDFGIIGKVDTALALSNSEDSSVTKSFKGLSSSSVQTVTVDVEAGEHFIDIKYKKDGSGDTGNDSLKFSVSVENGVGLTFDLSSYITNTYGTYAITAKGTAPTAGYTDSYLSDAVTYDLGHPAISISSGVLTITNIHTSTTSIAVYADGAQVATLACSDGADVTANMTDILDDTYTNDYYNITVSCIGDGVDVNTSNSVRYYVNGAPIYGVSWTNDETTTMERTDDAVGLGYVIDSTAGTIASDFDDIFTWETVTEDGNELVVIPDMYIRVTLDDDGNICAVAESETPGDGDGTWYYVKGFKYGAKGASANGSGLASVSGVSRLVSTTRASFRTKAAATGDGYQQLDLPHRWIMIFLWWIEWATKNSKAVMRGRISGSGTSGGSSMCACGGTDDVSTPSGFNPATGQMKWHGIEDFIGNTFEWIDGVSGSANNKIYVCDDASKFSDTVGADGYEQVNYTYSLSDGYCITAFGWDSEHPFMVYPTKGVSDSSYAKGFCNGVWAINSSNPVLYSGAYWDNSSADRGLVCFNRSSASGSGSSVGGRLLKT